MLLCGPPGTGKTALVKALVKDTGSVMFAPEVAETLSKWQGESEKFVKCLFEVVCWLEHLLLSLLSLVTG